MRAGEGAEGAGFARFPFRVLAALRFKYQIPLTTEARRARKRNEPLALSVLSVPPWCKSLSRPASPVIIIAERFPSRSLPANVARAIGQTLG